MALAHVGIDTRTVYLYDHGNGETDPVSDPVSEADILLVALAGIQAQSWADGRDGVDVPLSMYFGAADDRHTLEKLAECCWLAHGSHSVWYRVQYDRAMVFVQGHWAAITAVANALLSEPGYPKYVLRAELTRLLAQHSV